MVQLCEVLAGSLELLIEVKHFPPDKQTGNLYVRCGGSLPAWLYGLPVKKSGKPIYSCEWLLKWKHQLYKNQVIQSQDS